MQLPLDHGTLTEDPVGTIVAPLKIPLEYFNGMHTSMYICICMQDMIVMDNAGKKSNLGHLSHIYVHTYYACNCNGRAGKKSKLGQLQVKISEQNTFGHRDTLKAHV